MRAISLFAVLLVFWLALSGHYTSFLIGAGVLCCAFVTFMATRKDALEVKGDSMIDAGIHDGDLVVIERRDSADDGDIVVALVEDEEATLVRLRAHRVEFIDPLVGAHGGSIANTAGDSLLAARRLARPDSREILIVGAGTVGRSLRQAYGAAFPEARFSWIFFGNPRTRSWIS